MAASGYDPIVLHRPKIVVFGDSLTERGSQLGGWCVQMQHDYTRKVGHALCVTLSPFKPHLVRLAHDAKP